VRPTQATASSTVSTSGLRPDLPRRALSSDAAPRAVCA